MIIASELDADSGTYIGPIQIKNQAFVVSIDSVAFVGQVDIEVRPLFRDVEAGWLLEKSYTAPAYEISNVLIETWEVRAYIASKSSGTINVTLVASDGEP